MPNIPVKLPWSVEEWHGTNVKSIMDDWRFVAFMEAWGRAIIEEQRSEVYIALAMASSKFMPQTLMEVTKDLGRLEKMMIGVRRGILSEKRLRGMLLRAKELATKEPAFFPSSIPVFEFLTTVTDFSDYSIKKFKLKGAFLKDLRDMLAEAAIGYAILSINEQMGLTKGSRPKGRLPFPPGRKGFSHYCPNCGKIINQRVLYSYVNYKIEEEIPTEYSLTECRRCGGPNLFMREDEGWGFLAKTEFHLWPGDGRDNAGIVPYPASLHYRKATEYEKRETMLLLYLKLEKPWRLHLSIYCRTQKDSGMD